MGAMQRSVSLGDVYEIETYQPRKGVGHLLSRVRAEMFAALDKALEATRSWPRWKSARRSSS